jgi:hypothetical protein
MAYVEVPVDVRARFEIDRLSIVAELVAAKHQFVFKGKNVAVSIPGPDKAGLPFDLQRLHLYKWR